MKEPVQHSTLCGQQAGVKGLGDGPAVPVHSFTQDSKALKERRVELAAGLQKTDWALMRTRTTPGTWERGKEPWRELSDLRLPPREKHQLCSFLTDRPSLSFPSHLHTLSLCTGSQPLHMLLHLSN